MITRKFFTKIKQVKEDGLLNINILDTATWYKVIFENFVTDKINDLGIRESSILT